MGIADEVLLKIRALVEGQTQVRGLAGDVSALDTATSRLDGTYRDVNGRLRDAQGRFVAAGQAAREAGSGFAFAGGHLGKFSVNLTGLNAGLEIVQRVTQTVQGLMKGVGDLAHQFEASQSAARQWEVVLERYGINAKTADEAMLSLSNRTGVNVESLKGMAAQYVKMGGTLEDFEKGALAAASSWNDLSVKSISLEDSISNVTTGLAQGRSELMESSGIVVNASQAWEKWAEANDRTVKSMTDAEKAHAYALAVYKEEEIGISTLAERQTDLVKAETQAANAKKELGKAVGEIVLPFYTRYVQLGAEVTTQALEIARAFVQGGDAVQALSQKYPQLAGTLQVIQRVFTDVRDTARDVFERTIQPALERLAPKAQQMGSVVAPAFTKLGQVLKEVGGTAREAFERVIVPLFEAVAPVVMRVVQRVLPLLAELAGAFSEYFKMVVASWENIALPVIQTIAPIVERSVDVIANVLGGVITVVKNIFQAVRAMIEGNWSKAWEHLSTAVGTALLSVQTLLQGAWKIIADVAPKAWEKAKALGTSIKDGILTGIANLQDELAQAVGRALQNMLGYIPEWAQRLLNITADGQSTMQYTGASGTLGSLQSMLGALGLSGIAKSQGYGANKNNYGYGPRGHPGVDYAAPVGTKLYAPIAGTASYGYDHLSGRFIKLVDAEGNAIKLSHLSKVGEQLDAMMKAAGGAVQVAKGQLLGYSGGAKSDPMRGNSTGPHVDIMIYSKDGTIQNPERFRIGQGSRSPVPVPVTSPAAPPKAPKPSTPPAPVNTANPVQPEKAEDIRKRVEAQIKDILARVDIGVISKQAAIKLLQGIDDQATAVAKKQGKGWQEYAATAKSAESAIQSLAKTKKEAKSTVDVLTALSAQFEYAGKTGLPAYVKGLEAYIAQQERARKAAKDGSKEEVEATQNVNRARQMLKDAQVGKGTAFVTEADLKKYRAGAEEVIRLEKAMATSTDVDWKRRAQNRITAYSEQGQAAQNVLNLLKSQDQTETNLAEKAKAREKEKKALIARAAQEARDLREKDAQATLNRVKEMNRADLDAFKGSAEERLALIRAQTQEEYEAAEKVARIKRDNALRESANQGGPNRAARDAQIRQEYTDFVTGLKNTRIATVREATQAVEDYWKSASKDADQYKGAEDHFTRLKEGAKGAGGAVAGFVLSIEDAVAGLPEATEAQADYLAGMKLLEENGTAAAGAVNAVTEAIAQKAKAERQATQDAADLEMLNIFGGGEAGLKRVFDAFGVSGIDQLKLIDPEAAAQVERVFKSTLAQMQADLEKQAEAGRAVLENFKAEADALADETARNADQAVEDKNAFDASRVKQMQFSGAGTMLDFLNKAGEGFGDSYWTTLGEEGRARFTEALNGFKPEDFAALGSTVLRGLIDRIGDAPEWAELKAKLQAGMNVAVESDATSSAGDAIDGIITRYDALDLTSGEAADTIEQELIPALEAIAAASKDDSLKAYVQEAVKLMKEGAGAARGFAASAREVAETLAEGDAVAPLAQRFTELSDGLENGTLTLTDFRDGVNALRPELEALAASGNKNAQALLAGLSSVSDGLSALGDSERELQAAMGAGTPMFDGQIRALQALKEKFPELAAQIDPLIAKWVELQQKTSQKNNMLDKVQQFGQYAQQAIPMVTAAMQALGGASEEEAAAWGESLSSMVNDVVNFATAIAKGDYIGAAIQALTSIFTYFARKAQEARAEMKRTADYNKQFKFDKNGYGTRDVTTTTTGFLFWEKTIYTEHIDEVSRDLALSFEGAVVNGIQNGFQEAVQKNDSSILTKAITADLKEAAFKGLIDAFMNSAEVAALMGPLVQKLIAAFKSGNKDQINAALADFRTGVQALKPELDALVAAGKEIDDALTDPADRAAALAASERDLATSRNNNYQAGLKLQLTQGLITKQQYDALLLKSEHDRLNLEMEAALANTELTEEQRAEIKEGFRIQNAQLDADYAKEQAEQEWQRVAARTDMTLNAEQQALELKHKKGLISEEEYQKGMLDLTIKRLEKERAAEIAKAGGDKALIDATNAYYDAAIENAKWDSANAGKSAGESFADGFEDALRKREDMLQSWRDSLRSGVAALLSGDNPLQGLYDSVRQRIGQALQEGLVVKRIIGRLDPLFEQLDGALNSGLNPNSIIQQIGAKLPGLAIEMQTSLGPIIAALNQALGHNTAAVKENTKAIENQASHVANFNLAPVSDVMRRKLGRFA